MRPRSTPIAVLLSLAALAIFAYPSSASAVTIHMHTQVPVRPVVGHFDTGPMRVTAMRPVERVVRIAPVDSDQDGFADTEDNCPNTASTVNGGCPPAPTVAAQSVPSVAPSTPVASSVPAAPVGGTLDAIRYCESGGSYTAVNPSGAGGAYQMMPSTWQSLGYSGLPQDAPAAEQDAAAAQLYAEQGTTPWIASEGCWG